jgi:hypothetical protein
MRSWNILGVGLTRSCFVGADAMTTEQMPLAAQIEEVQRERLLTGPELVREWLELQGPSSRAGSALIVPARLPAGRSKKHFRDTRTWRGRACTIIVALVASACPRQQASRNC